MAGTSQSEELGREALRRAQLPRRLATGKLPPNRISKTPATSPISGPRNASPGQVRRRRSHSLNASISRLSLQSDSPSFEPPQTVLPTSNEEQVLSQELALCDFRAYLLAMEAQNRERLRDARGDECTCYDADIGLSDEDPHVRDYQMATQATELRQRRTELQIALEKLTGRPYPLPETYVQAKQRPVKACGVDVIPAFQFVNGHASGSRP